MLNALKHAFVWIVDQIGWIVDTLFLWVFELLPESPFQFEAVEWGAFGQLIGVFFPVADMFTHLSGILLAVGSYYLVRHLLRIIRVIE